MKRKTLGGALLLALAGTLVSVPAHAATPQEGVARIAGEDRMGTAVDVSKARFATGTADVAIVTRSDNFADALAAAPLAADRNGPLLLNPTGALDERVRSEIARVLKPGGTIIVLGGQGAISGQVEADLQAIGTVKRIEGVDRYDTAVKVASEVTNPRNVSVVTGRNFPDGLAAGALMSVLENGDANGVVLLSDDGVLPEVTRNYLTAKNVLQNNGRLFAVGGKAAQALSGIPHTKDFSGVDRYQTAEQVAVEFSMLGGTFTGQTSALGVATGENWPDALAASPALGAAGGPLLLSRPDSLPSSTEKTIGLFTAAYGKVTHAYVFGGPTTLSPQVQQQVSNALSIPVASTAGFDTVSRSRISSQPLGETPSPVQNLKLTAINATTLQATWTPPARGTFSGYKLFTNQTGEITLPPTQTSYTFNTVYGLNDYYVSVTPIGQGYQGPVTASFTFPSLAISNLALKGPSVGLDTGATATIRATLTGDGKPLANRELIFYRSSEVDGPRTELTRVRTDANGVAQITRVVTPQLEVIRVAFEGNAYVAEGNLGPATSAVNNTPVLLIGN